MVSDESLKPTEAGKRESKGYWGWNLLSIKTQWWTGKCFPPHRPPMILFPQLFFLDFILPAQWRDLIWCIVAISLSIAKVDWLQDAHLKVSALQTFHKTNLMTWLHLVSEDWASEQGRVWTVVASRGKLICIVIAMSLPVTPMVGALTNLMSNKITPSNQAPVGPWIGRWKVLGLCS